MASEVTTRWHPVTDRRAALPLASVLGLCRRGDLGGAHSPAVPRPPSHPAAWDRLSSPGCVGRTEHQPGHRHRRQGPPPLTTPPGWGRCSGGWWGRGEAGHPTFQSPEGAPPPPEFQTRQDKPGAGRAGSVGMTTAGWAADGNWVHVGMGAIGSSSPADPGPSEGQVV